MSDPVTALDGTFLELEEKDESAHMHIGARSTCASTSICSSGCLFRLLKSPEQP